jgi:putative addiction module CopG family antidote
MAHPLNLNVTLSDATAEFVRDKVSSGEYASENDVINEGLEVLKAEADERKRWEQEVVIPSYERFIANPSSAIPLEKVMQNLAAKRRERRKAS